MLETGSPKSKSQQHWFLSEGLRETVPSLSSLVLAAGYPWRPLIYRCSPLSLHGNPACLYFPLMRATVIGLGHSRHQYDFILMWLHLQRPYFETRSQPEAPGVKVSLYLFGGHGSTRDPLLVRILGCHSSAWEAWLGKLWA